MVISILSLSIPILLFAHFLEATNELQTLSEWVDMETWDSVAGKDSVKEQVLAFLKVEVNKEQVYLRFDEYLASVGEVGKTKKKVIFTCDYVRGPVVTPLFVAGIFSETSSTFAMTNAGKLRDSEDHFYHSTLYAYCEEWIGGAAVTGHPILSQKLAKLKPITGTTVVRCWFVSDNKAIVIFDVFQKKGYSFVTMQIYDDNQIEVTGPTFHPTLAEVHCNIIQQLKTSLPFHSGWTEDSTRLSVFAGLTSKLKGKAKWIGNVNTLTVLAVNNDFDKMSCTLWKQKESWSTGKTLFIVWTAENRPVGGPDYQVKHIGWWSKSAEDAANLCRRCVRRLVCYGLKKETNFEHGMEWLSPDERGISLNSVMDYLKLNTENKANGDAWVCQKRGIIPSRSSDDPLTVRILSVWENKGFMTIVVNLHDFTQENVFKLLYIEERRVIGESRIVDCDTKLQGILNTVYPPLSPKQLTWDFVTLDISQNFVVACKGELENSYEHPLLHLKPILASSENGMQLVILRADCNNKANLLYANWHTKGITWAGALLGFDNLEEEISGLATIQERALDYTNKTIAGWTPQDPLLPQGIKRLCGNQGIIEIQKRSERNFVYSFRTEDNVAVWMSDEFETLQLVLQQVAWYADNPFLRVPLNSDEESFKKLGFHNFEGFVKPTTPAEWVGYKMTGNTVLYVYRKQVNSTVNAAEEAQYEYWVYTGVSHGSARELILTHKPGTELKNVTKSDTTPYSVEGLIAELGIPTQPFLPDMSSVLFYELPIQSKNWHLTYTGPIPWVRKSGIERVRSRSINSGSIEICLDSRSCWFFILRADPIPKLKNTTVGRELYVAGVMPCETDVLNSSQKFLALPTALCESSLRNGIAWYTECEIVTEVTKTILTNTGFSESSVLSIGLLPSTELHQREAVFEYGVVIRVDKYSCISSIGTLILTFCGLIRVSFERGQQRCSKELAELDISNYARFVQTENFTNVLNDPNTNHLK